MSNKKFHFEFKKKTPKTQEFFFHSCSKMKLQLLLISKVYHFYYSQKKKFILFICLKNKKYFLNYNKCKLLIFTKKIKKSLSTRMNTCLEAGIYIYI